MENLKNIAQLKGVQFMPEVLSSSKTFLRFLEMDHSSRLKESDKWAQKSELFEQDIEDWNDLKKVCEQLSKHNDHMTEHWKQKNQDCITEIESCRRVSKKYKNLSLSILFIDEVINSGDEKSIVELKTLIKGV